MMTLAVSMRPGQRVRRWMRAFRLGTFDVLVVTASALENNDWKPSQCRRSDPRLHRHSRSEVRHVKCSGRCPDIARSYPEFWARQTPLCELRPGYTP